MAGRVGWRAAAVHPGADLSQNSGDWGHTENTLPDIAELTGPDRGDPGEIEAQMREQLGYRTRARQPQIEGSDPGAVADLRRELGI